MRSFWQSSAERLFVPILAGATIGERLLACLGAVVGIAITSFFCALVFGSDPYIPLIVAPIGASAVLVFAVPASPLAQPWPVIGGNTISAAVGVTVMQLPLEPSLAAGLAVGLAILAMSFARCLHPPGGAAALTTVIGGPAVLSAGYEFVFIPVAINSIVLVVLGVIAHKLSGRSYPHVPKALPTNSHQTSDAPPALRVGFDDHDIDAALTVMNESFDIDRDDLDRLMREVELQAMLRRHGEVLCSDIMSRDVIGVGLGEAPARARSLLLQHGVRTLPVVDPGNRLVGTVGLRELTGQSERLADLMVSPVTASPYTPAFALLQRMSDGIAHATIIADENHRVLGMVTQTDLLAAAAKRLSHASDHKAPEAALETDHH